MSGTRCGAAVDTDGLVTVYAQSVTEMNRLAQMAVADRGADAVLDKPPWLEAALEALAAGEDLDGGNDVIR